MVSALLQDNPLLVKHLRARLRPQTLIPWIAIVVILCVLAAYASHALDEPEIPFYLLLVLQGFLLQLVGSSQVLASVSRARESGMLEFHRMSPQPPGAIVLGFLLGGPILEYLLFACTLPFSFFIALGQVGLLPWLAISAEMLIVALLYHAAAVLAGLMLPRATSSPVVLLALFFVLMPLWGLAMSITPLLFLTVFPIVTAAVTPAHGIPQFGSLPWSIAISLLHQLPVLILLLFAATRKMRHEGTPPFSKLEAIVAYALGGLLALLDVGVAADRPETLFRGGSGNLAIASCYGLFLLGLLLILAVSPDASSFARGSRQARRLGQRGLSLWHDHAPNWVATAAFLVICIIIGLALVSPGISLGSETALWAPATAACALAFFALTKQSFNLFFRKNSTLYLLLVLFLFWGVPLVLGLLLSMAEQTRAAETVISLSPLAGIGISLWPHARGGETAAVVTAFTASAVLAICSVVLCRIAVQTAAQGVERTT